MRITFLCKELHCLPHTGGLFDQHATSVNRIEQVLKASNQYQRDEIAKAESKNKGKGKR